MKVYSVGIVGESNYQAAIRGCSVGERVLVCHEPDNPYDDQALRVETMAGEVIGYIAKTNWLRGAIHDQGRGCAATVGFVGDNGAGIFGVVLNVTLTDDIIPTRAYSPRASTAKSVRPSVANPESAIRSVIDRATLTVTCTCGETYEWAAVRLAASPATKCPRCKEPDELSPEQMVTVEAAIIEAVSKSFGARGGNAPSSSMVREFLWGPHAFSQPQAERRPPASKSLWKRMFG